MKPWLVVLPWLLVSGCALSHTVDDDIFVDMSVDKKLRLFEAENDISIAIDERDQMHDRIRDLKQEIRSAKAERRAAESDMAREQDRDGTKLAAFADAMWERRLTYLDSSIDYLRDRIDAQDTVINVARAKFELAKALLIKKNKLAGAESINVKDFERQLLDCNEKMRIALAAMERNKGKLERIRADWLKLRDDVASGRLHSLATPGDDELPVWEAW